MLQPVLVRPLPGGTLRADRRRAPLARGAARRPRARSRRSCARHDDAASLELALIENMAREDLNPLEEARACAALVEELGLTREDVGRRVGRSRVAVSNLIRLLDLPDEALELLERGALSEGHGRALLLAEDHDDAPAPGARAPPQAGWSVRELERRARATAASRGAAPRPAGARRRCTPTRQPRVEQPRRRASATALGTRGRRSRPQGDGYRARARLRVARRGARARPSACGARRRRLTRPLESPLAGRLAQSVRALL